MNLLQRLFGGQSRNNAPEIRLFVEAMLILIAADGVVEESELDGFVRQVHTRPEFQGIKQRDVDAYVQTAFGDIRRDGIDARINEIAAGLPKRDHRVAALGMAITIAVGDGGVAPAESSVLEKLRRAFELSEADFHNILLSVENGESVDSILDTESGGRGCPEAHYIETILLMAAADGVLEPRELDRFGLQLAEHAEFQSLTPDQAAHILDLALRRLEREGVESRIEAIANGLPEPDQRMVAFRLALEMCVADGDASAHERTLLRLLQRRFDLSDDQVRAQLDAVLGVLHD